MKKKVLQKGYKECNLCIAEDIYKKLSKHYGWIDLSKCCKAFAGRNYVGGCEWWTCAKCRKNCDIFTPYSRNQCPKCKGTGKIKK